MAPPKKTRLASRPTAPQTARARGRTDDDTPSPDRVMAKQAAVERVAAMFASNENKAAEHGDAARTPHEGAHVAAPDEVTGSTLTEKNDSGKTGSGAVRGFDPGSGPLDRVRSDGSDRALTTNQGVAIADNQSSLKGGLRASVLMEDFILREKITHFDHERIPERVVHARGSAAHGTFECLTAIPELTRASLFAEAGKRTPVFARFSTVAGERGSTDVARDVRGFAVKFYTDEGNWDLVGNNIPVFFIQDAMKFPDLIHAVKPEPHHGMPQAASAHDTFWDFVSLTPESTHTLMWVMSDRAIPRSYRMMQGFGVHTFRLVDGAGEARFVKFHWLPKAGTHSLVWDEAVKLSGADPDFHRRDLWEAIESGAYPEWELALQVFDEAQAARFDFDVLDPTKLVPEELVPLQVVGRMVLDRNPDDFFAETEQVAFCAAHVVPGIDFTEDPLLAGRLHSYADTQITRLGGPNFHQIPINAPLAPVHNQQRDGLHRQTIERGRVAYEPSSLGGGCPYQAGPRGFTSAPIATRDTKVRGKPELFAEHFRQATLFWNSQAPHEQKHILGAFRFELTKVETPAVRARVVSMLRNVSDELAAPLAAELGMALPEPMTPAMTPKGKPRVARSPALSLTFRPGAVGVATRRVAILVADGTSTETASAIRTALEAEGAEPRYVSARLGRAKGAGGELPIEGTLETMPSVVWDAVAVPDGDEGVEVLAALGRASEMIGDAYRHGKPLLFVGGARRLFEATLAGTKADDDPRLEGVVLADEDALEGAIDAWMKDIAAHRAYARETDPPRV